MHTSCIKYFLALICAVLLTACGSPLPSLVGASLNPQCTVGAPRILRAGEVRVDVLTVNEGARALERIGGGLPGAEYAMDIYHDVKSGNISRFTGDGMVTIRVFAVNHGAIPSQVPFLSGMASTGATTKDGICRGYAPVRVVGTMLEVTVPMRGGEHLGQASIILPRAAFAGRLKAAPCITWSFPVYVPELTAGPMRGKENTSCGMGGSVSETTLFGQRMNDHSQNWTLMAGIAKGVR